MISTHDDLMDQAGRLFSRAYVAALARMGQDILESGSQGHFIRDEEGRQFLDAFCSGGSTNLGRRPERLVRELTAASQETDQGNFVLISKEKVLLAERLARFMPVALPCAYFTVVRGEAVDAACKLARGRTGRTGLVAFEGAGHGDTGFALSLSQYPDKSRFGDLVPDTHTIPFNDRDALEKAVGPDTAAVIIESVQVENGCAVPLPSFLKQVEAHCRKAGALLIVDETQTGFGRTGRRFSLEHAGLSPDILVFGEAVCNGMFNLCGLSFTTDLKTFFDDHPLIHLCTYGGHDVGCRVAAAALDLYEEITPWENAATLAGPFREILTTLGEQHPKRITGVSATGLVGAVLLDSAETAARFCRLVKEAGAIVRPGRVNPAAVIVRPPLTIVRDELEILGKALMSAGDRL